MKAMWRGHVIADSDRTLSVGGYRYFPRETVRMGWLRPAPQTPHDLECPHGVRFYDIVADDGTRSHRAAWSYEAAGPSMKQVEHWIGFWEDVEIA